MKEEVSVTQYTCDACGKILRTTTSDEFVGLEGTVFEATQTQGSGADWYACSRKCVGKAVAQALDKAWED